MTYIIMCGIADYISGAPIYYRNKAVYLESQGWNVVVLPARRGKVYVKDLARYARGSFPLMGGYPATLTASQRERVLSGMLEAVGPIEGDCIVETCTDCIAYWGELLAERLGARHMFMLLDESNPYLRKAVPFLEFKLDRGEFLAITPDVVANTFDGVREIAHPERCSFSAFCSNSVQDYESDLVDDLEGCDFVIGSIGRLEKGFVPGLVDAIARFATAHSDLSVGVAFFGGTNSRVAMKTVNALRDVSNIELVVSGFMWPFPKKALERVDVFASAAGSVTLSDSLGIPTIAMDATGAGAIGLSSSSERKAHPLFRVEGNRNPSDPTYYFEKVFEGGICRVESNFDIDAQWTKFCKGFQSQLDYTLSLDSPNEYFDTSRLPIPRVREKVLHTLFLCGGMPIFDAYWRATRKHGVFSKDVFLWE